MTPSEADSPTCELGRAMLLESLSTELNGVIIVLDAIIPEYDDQLTPEMQKGLHDAYVLLHRVRNDVSASLREKLDRLRTALEGSE